VITALDTVFRSTTEFDCQLTNARWFDTDVLWLEPEPAAPFRALTAAVLNAFPEYPPYGGIHDDVIPHLTVGERRLAGLSALQDAERSVRRGLPVAHRVTQVLLVAGTSEANSWRTMSQFELGGVIR
jgi:2'-5' RNA ligase